MSESYEGENVWRALLGTVSIIGGWFCFVYCCYKFALCRKKEEEKIQTIIVSPSKSVVTETVCLNCEKNKYSSLV